MTESTIERPWGVVRRGMIVRVLLDGHYRTAEVIKVGGPQKRKRVLVKCTRTPTSSHIVKPWQILPRLIINRRPR